MIIDYTNFEEWYRLNYALRDPKIIRVMKDAFEAGRKLGEDEGARNPYC